MLIIYRRCPLSVSDLGQYSWVLLGFDLLPQIFVQQKEKGSFDRYLYPSVNLSPVSFFSPYVLLLVTPIGEFSGVYLSMHWFFILLSPLLSSLQTPQLRVNTNQCTQFKKRHNAIILIINI